MTHSVLFVCLGNICRSPLAEGIFRAHVLERGLAEHFRIDSAGTGSWHTGNPPDARSVEVAARHGIDISGQRARQVTAEDFGTYDTILAMDRSNLTTLEDRAGSRARNRLRLFLADPAMDVPDPYYGGQGGFDEVFRLIQDGSERLLDTLAHRKPAS